MKLIPLTGTQGAGKYAKVDKAGYIKAMRATRHWYLDKSYVRGTNKETGKPVYLHRFLMDCPQGFIVDHLDGDPLNCKYSNLRATTGSVNSRNKKIKRPGFLGVHFSKSKQKWTAQIKIDGRGIFLGSFHNKNDARRAYRDAALKLDPMLAKRFEDEWSDL